MAAFLTTDGLRVRTARFRLGCAPHPAVALSGPHKAPRPVLTARWSVACDGRVACRWQTDVAAPFGPPPD